MKLSDNCLCCLTPCMCVSQGVANPWFLQGDGEGGGFAPWFKMPSNPTGGDFIFIDQDDQDSHVRAGQHIKDDFEKKLEHAKKQTIKPQEDSDQGNGQTKPPEKRPRVAPG